MENLKNEFIFKILMKIKNLFIIAQINLCNIGLFIFYSVLHCVLEYFQEYKIIWKCAKSLI